MSNYRKYHFEPGKIYKLSDVPKYFRFVRSELVMESFVLYRFVICDEGIEVDWHEDKDRILYLLTLAEPAAQVLYGQEKQLLAPR